VRESTKVCLMGLATLGMGLFPLLASFDVIPTDDGDFGAPRWFVASIGYLFVLIGAWLTLSRAPQWPLTGLLRAFMAPLLYAQCALFCAAVVIWSRRVHAGPHTRALFLGLAVLFVLAAAGAVSRAAAGLRRRRRPEALPETPPS
jgi:hypothetical protein